MAITRAEQLRAGKNCTDSTVDNDHALHTHEALHGVTAIKVYVNFFCLGFGGPLALGALGCSPFSPLGNPGLTLVQELPRSFGAFAGGDWVIHIGKIPCALVFKGHSLGGSSISSL